MINDTAAKFRFSGTIFFRLRDAMRFVPTTRWKQFSLGTLFVFLTLLCILFGPWSDRAHRQRRAVAAISRLGGSVAYRGESWHDFDRRNRTPAWLKKLIGQDFLDPVTVVSLSGEEFHDEDLVCLEDLPDVEEIWIPESITDVGLDHLRGMTHLEQVHLHGPGFTDAGLRKLRALPGLRWFTSQDARISDEGLRELSRHSKLQDLHLYTRDHRLPITDAGIRQLLKLKNLRWLILDADKISEGAVKDLQRALPQCDVWINPPFEEE